MSGVYIPAMEMPTSCRMCKIEQGNSGYWWCGAMKKYKPTWNFRENRPEWCPLVLVSEHGRLGDLDELLDRAFGCLDEETFLAFQFLVNGSVTIIPADKEGE